MTSENQTRANHANAQSSTGPKTEAGKAVSAQNARKHGLSGLTLYVPENRQDEFQELYDLYLDQVRPIGEIQMEYFERLVHAKWNANIARELHVHALLELDDKKITNAMRYVTQWDRAYDKALKALREDQADLALRAIPENEPIGALPMTCPVRRLTVEATRLARFAPRAEQPAARYATLAAIGHVFGPRRRESTNPPINQAIDQAA